ncbi:MAG: alpha/beta hydrolase [SAR202 cluster bacterium]|jgi:pimeloyl-ACP methyl ester carboxylesterase|nr:alpha/beta hydrolase [SAR202 cluster bacterium]MDP6302800.1 alpha/beta hydrolase [SAR202 cluster bacterium]MDP7105287.1 alpha/beta hydrolase [SAR202 cluster bacterium]MDP7226899.1 alpha/beta hydrolase [SAR202 cluster bacterium]MDP7533449.1 alpha/beta hydrolase [SAR202 cluster bacterium]|tara:strand:+ start:1304 stop:1840 length:537 start_codon:yes stop_codon:yes gene_type:complete
MPIVQAGAIQLEYFDVGHGDRTVVLVHGASSSARIWHTVQELLAAAGVRAVAIGMRGAGASHRSNDPNEYNSETYGNDLAAPLVQLEIQRFSLVGHSLGVRNAAYFMRDHASGFDVQSVILMAGGDLSGRQAPTAEELSSLDESLRNPPNDEASRRAAWEPLHTGLPSEARDALWQDI